MTGMRFVHRGIGSKKHDDSEQAVGKMNLYSGHCLKALPIENRNH